MRFTATATAIGTLLVVGIVAARSSEQSQAPPKPTFAVVSVTRVAPNLLPTIPDLRVSPSASFLATGTVEGFIEYAYSVQRSKVAGGPEWIRTDKFKINAQAAEAVSVETTRLMVQSLLEDRFRLVIRKSGEGGGIIIPGLFVIDSAQPPTEN